MLVKVALACVIATAPFLPGSQSQEDRPKVPNDSLLVVITGCVKGRVIRAADVRQPDTTTGPTIRSTTFRLAGKKDVMNLVKEQDGQRAEITGLIKKSALIEQGMKFKGGRVVIGGGSGASGSSSMPSPAENVLVLDAISVQGLGGSCSS